MISLVDANYRSSNTHLLLLYDFYHDWHHHLIITAVDKESEFLAPKGNLDDLLFGYFCPWISQSSDFLCFSLSI